MQGLWLAFYIISYHFRRSYAPIQNKIRVNFASHCVLWVFTMNEDSCNMWLTQWCAVTFTAQDATHPHAHTQKKYKTLFLHYVETQHKHDENNTYYFGLSACTLHGAPLWPKLITVSWQWQVNWGGFYKIFLLEKNQENTSVHMQLYFRKKKKNLCKVSKVKILQKMFPISVKQVTLI